MFLANLPIYKKLSGARSASFARQLSELITPGSAILDFGCGNMYTSLKLLQYLPDISITGIDVIRDQNLTDETLSHNAVKFMTYDTKALPFDNDTFDVAVALATMHHTPDPEYYMKELKRVIKPTGHIILIEEMYINVIDKIYIMAQDWILNKMKKGVPVPLQFRSKSQYLKQFEIQNLQIEYAGAVRPVPTFMHHYVYKLSKI
ncbi:MAG: class I SAM-dependent methyltransferase [Cytophagales bacterium]|nr:class I SAM-dependent methyltransferase [Cytophagales bacterium]